MGGCTYLVSQQKDGAAGRYWRLKYRVRGKEKVLAIGTYPEIGLREAREARDDAKKLLVRGTDPSEKKRASKIVQADTFRLVAEEWLGLQARKLADVTLEKGRLPR